MNPDGEITDRLIKEFPIHMSNVLLIDPELQTGVRVKYGYNEQGKRIRVSLKTGNLIDKPSRSELTYQARNDKKQDGVKDTAPSDVLSATYKGEDFAILDEEFKVWAE
jgi:large subunit ribosomal protein L24